MRIITLKIDQGIGSTAGVSDENGDPVKGLTALRFDNLNVFELWTGTLVFLDGATPDERVYFVTA